MRKLILIVIAILPFWLWIGCDSPEQSQPETPSDSSLNTPPYILELTADPFSLEPEGTTTITCIAMDNESNTLNYNWNASLGDIAGAGSAVIYSAPSIRGEYTVSCIVDDGLDSSDIRIVTLNTYNWTMGLVVDVDGNSYPTIQLGNQEWMAGNLKVTKYRDSTDIATIYSGSEWGNLDETETGAYVAYNHNKSGIYGYLYNWYAAVDTRNIAPVGWHVPSDEEWKELERFLGMTETEVNNNDYRGTNEGSKLAGNSELIEWGWNDLRNDSEFGSSGFVALPGGTRDAGSGNFYSEGGTGYFWVTTEHDWNEDYAWSREINQINTSVRRLTSYKASGRSIRCIKD